MQRMWGCLVIVVVSTVFTAMAAAESPQEQAVWKLEHDYWEYVKNFDLPGYRSLWNEDFVGWPQSSISPVHKANITDWFMEHKSKGEEFSVMKLEPAASQAFGDSLVVTHYWITAGWAPKGQTAKPSRSRITHTWMRTKDGWQIIGGMSAPAGDVTSR